MLNKTIYVLTRDPEFAEDHGVGDFTLEAYGSVVLLMGCLLAVPAAATWWGSFLLRHTGVWKPKWMHRSWASQADAYRLLLQEIYAAGPARPKNVLVGGGAIATQALVLLLIALHLFGFWSKHTHTEFYRLAADDAPILGLGGRCVAFLIVSVRIVQSGDFKRDYKMMRYAAEHPGPLAGNACAFAIATCGVAMGLANACLGAVLIVRADSILHVMTSFAGLAYIFDIDDWVVKLFELESNDLKWLDCEPSDAKHQYAPVLSEDPEEEAHHPQLRTTPSVLTVARKAIFFGVYPAVFTYLFLFWIPARSMPKAAAASPAY